MFVVDTNVLIYGADKDSPDHARCRRLTERHRHVAAEIFAEVPGITGNLVFVAHTAILMRENGIRTIYTRDTDFNRFPFLDTVDPVTDNRRTSTSGTRSKPRG
jgi:predicted nucleic acid-binding protein